MSSGQKPMDLNITYCFLEDGGRSHRIDVTPAFWEELMADDYRSPESKLVGTGSGWLLSRYRMDRSPDHWEMHPEGDEMLILQSGRMEILLENEPGNVRSVALSAGETCLVPKGVWHTQKVLEPSQLLAITFGRGTEHR